MKKRSSGGDVSEFEDDDDDDLIDEKKQKELNKIYTIFPKVRRAHILKTFRICNCNAKKCIDALLAEERSTDNDEDLEIEEWSDGDGKIREKNKKNKEERRVTKPLVSSSESSTSSLQSVSSTSITNRKRKFSSDAESKFYFCYSSF